VEALLARLIAPAKAKVWSCKELQVINLLKKEMTDVFLSRQGGRGLG